MKGNGSIHHLGVPLQRAQYMLTVAWGYVTIFVCTSYRPMAGHHLMRHSSLMNLSSPELQLSHLRASTIHPCSRSSTLEQNRLRSSSHLVVGLPTHLVAFLRLVICNCGSHFAMRTAHLWSSLVEPKHLRKFLGNRRNP